MKNFARQVVAPMLSVAALVFFAALTGCEKDKPAPGPQERATDPAYRSALKESRDSQKAIAHRRLPLEANAERMRARAKAALGKDATDAQVEAELDANPAKYPGWRELKSSLTQAEKDMNAEQARVRATIRQRILKEAAEKKAAQKTK